MYLSIHNNSQFSVNLQHLIEVFSHIYMQSMGFTDFVCDSYVKKIALPDNRFR